MLGLAAVVLATTPLTLGQALERAAQTPAVVAAQQATADFHASAERLSAVVVGPSVGVQTGVRNAPASGWGPEVYVNASQPVFLAPLAAHRRATVDAEARTLGARASDERRRARLAVAQVWFAAWTAEHRLALAAAERDAAKDAHERMARAQAGGALTKDEVAVAAAYAAEAELGVLRAEGDRFLAHLAFRRVVGAAPSTDLATADELPDVPRPSADWVDHAPEPPAVHVAAAAVDKGQALLAEERSTNASTLSLGVNAGREGGGDLVGLLTAQVTFGSLDGNARAEAPLRAQLAHARGALSSAQLDAQTERAAAAHEVAHAEEVLHVAHEQLLPATLRAFEATQARFERGAATVQDWVFARRSWLAARAQDVVAQADFRHACFVANELGAPTP